MGPMYGYQWRHFGAEFDEATGQPVTEGVDQLQRVIDLIRNDPTSRRIIMTSYNPAQAEQGVLYPCHSLMMQFYVHGEFLDLNCYNRSADLFLGLPFNIASTALLHLLIAGLTGKTARNLSLQLGDVHIYESHIEAVKEQIARMPHSFPRLQVAKPLKELEDIENLVGGDFTLLDYDSHPAIKAEMVP